MLKSYKIEIKSTEEQINKINQTIGGRMRTIDELIQVAFLYRQERDSMKFACKNLDFVINKKEYQIVPFNMDKYTNTKTIEKRLSEYDEIIVFEYDYDIREILNKLNIEFHIFIPTISKGFLDNWHYCSFKGTKDIFMQKVPFDFTDEMIENTISKLLEIKKTITTYYVENAEIKERKIQLEPNIEPFNTDKKEVAKNYINNLIKQTEMMETTIFHNKEMIKKFKKKYKELLNEDSK